MSPVRLPKLPRLPSVPPAGLELAVSWLTVVPMPVRSVDRAAARGAIVVAPAVGALLGLVSALVCFALTLLGVAPLLAGLAAVALLAGLSRAMHLDGLADTADGLGVHGPAARSLAVMRDGGTGPFGVLAMVLAVVAQGAGIGSLVASGHWFAVVVATTAGRAAFTWCCRRGVPAAREDGMGALVADSQPAAVAYSWAGVLLVASLFVSLATPVVGPLAVVLAGASVVWLSRLTRRRLGGVTGDVLGACCELATTVVLAVCTLAG